MLSFKDYCEKEDLLEQFDIVISSFKGLNESNLGDLSSSNIIKTNLNRISSEPVRTIVGLIAHIAKNEGKSSKDILKIFTQNGIQKIKDVVSKIIPIGEIKYLLNKFTSLDKKDDPDLVFQKVMADLEATRYRVWEEWRLAQEQSTNPELRDIAISNRGKFTQNK
jgi:hypothetical protein